jgi:hypothetical protein
MRSCGLIMPKNAAQLAVEPLNARQTRLQQKQNKNRITGIRLHVDSPLLGIETKDLESALLAQGLNLVNHLVSSVIALAGKTCTTRRKENLLS